VGDRLRKLIFAAVGVALTGVLLASGSYMPRPPQPAARVIEDSGRYELGKAIFAGTAELSTQVKADREAQCSRLTELQSKLPARLKKTVDLPGLAGKLSPAQLLALEYFLKVRHKVTL
jgi:hypothetical protein